MSEYVSNDIEAEPVMALDREQIIKKLLELGVDVALEDWDDCDDNELLGNITMLAMMYGIDLEELLRARGTEATTNDGLGSRVYIVSKLQSHGIPIGAKDIEDVSNDALQRIVTWWAKEFGKNPEEIGRECFGDDWKERRWI